MQYHSALTMFVGFLSLITSGAAAQTVADFYRGKTVTMLVGTSSGNDYDYRARLVARHMGRHIPGEPTIVVRNVPGGGGIVAANNLGRIAPKDGSVMLASMQNMATLQALRSPGIEFDAREFYWIGNTTDSANVVAAWHTTGIVNIEQAQQKEVIMGGVMGNASLYYMTALNTLVGTKFKIVTGYPGGNEINLAMERGEVGGRGNSFASWYSTKPDWVASGKLRFLAQVGFKRDPRHQDVPLLVELARNEFDRKVLEFISADTATSRPIATTPGVSLDRVDALRRAFDATMKDVQFLADAAKENMDISPSSGEDAQKVVVNILSAPPEVVARAKEIIEGTGR